MEKTTKTRLDFSLIKFMDSWIYQPGFPLIQLSQTKENKYIIQQKVFTMQLEPLKKLIWEVPLFLENPLNATTSRRQIIWLTEENKTSSLNFFYKFKCKI